MACNSQSLLFDGSQLGYSLVQNVPITTIQQLMSNFSTTAVVQQLFSAWPVLVPFLAILVFAITGSIICCCQICCKDIVKCCKDQPYSMNNVARTGICTAACSLIVILLGSFGLIMANEAKLSIQIALCQSKSVLSAMSGGYQGMNSSVAAINLSDVNYNTKQLRYTYQNLIDTVQKPFIDGSLYTIPTTTLLRQYYNIFCGNMTIKDPKSGTDITVQPFQSQCSSILIQLVSWQNTITSLNSLKQQMGSGKFFNSLYKFSFRSWLNQVISGSYIVTYTASIALNNISGQMELVQPTLDQILLLGYIIPVVFSVLSNLISLILVLLPFMLYHYGLLKCVYGSWIMSICSTIFLIIFSMALMGSAFFSAQIASTMQDITLNSDNYNFSKLQMPDNFLLCMKRPNSKFFQIPPPTPIDYYTIFKNIIDAYDTLTIPDSVLQIAKSLHKTIDYSLSYPQYLKGTDVTNIFYQLNNCTQASGDTMTKDTCTGPNIRFVFSTIQCKSVAPTVSGPLLQNQFYCIQIQSSNSSDCTKCNPQPKYTAGQNFESLKNAAINLYILDTCDRCKTVIESNAANLQSYGVSVGPQLALSLLNLQEYLKQFQTQYLLTKKFLNSQWKQSMEQLVPKLGQFSYGLDCNSTILHVLQLKSIYRNLAGRLIFSGIFIIVLSAISIIQTFLIYYMTSRLRMYFLKQGMDDGQEVQDEDELPQIDWDKIRQEEQKQNPVFIKAYKQAHMKKFAQLQQDNLSPLKQQDQQQLIQVSQQIQQQNIFKLESFQQRQDK